MFFSSCHLSSKLKIVSNKALDSTPNSKYFVTLNIFLSYTRKII